MDLDIYGLSSAIVDETAAALPTQATYLGIAGHDGEWPDLSPSGLEALADLRRDQLARIDALPAVDDEWSQLAVDVARDELARDILFPDAGEDLQKLNSIASPMQDLRDAFEQMHPSTAQGWTDVASRLEKLPLVLQQYAATLALGKERGRAVARRQVVEVMRQARHLASGESLFDAFATKSAEVVDEATVARLSDGVLTAKAAFLEFSGFLESDYLPAAGEGDGVGRDRYSLHSARFLGTEIDPISTYEWGWSEV